MAAALLGTGSPARAQGIDLADVAAGRGGFVVEGEGRLPSGIGHSVSGAGDVNGDGIPDAIVAGRFWSYGAWAVPSYVVFGRADGAPVDLEDVLAGRGGFVIRGENEDDLSGWSVSGAGDVNGDGLDDVIIGAPGRWYTSGSYVVFGKAATEAVELSAVAAGQGGFVIRGESEYDESGSSVSGAGDVNGDGLADLIVGASLADPGGISRAGASYVVFGKATTEAVELSDVAAGEGGFVIHGESAGDRSGHSVSGAGDVNGDGLADLLIGAPVADPGGKENAGATYVVFGKATTEAVELSEVAGGQGGFVMRGENEDDRSGSSVSGACDVNGDGLADLMVGAPSADPGGMSGAGASYVVFGKATTEAVELSDVAAGQGGFVIHGESEGDRSGSSVLGAGDVNGDGVPDLVIGTYSSGLDGADSNDDGLVDISDAVATLGFLFRGDPAPPVPGPKSCGIDPTADALGCESSTEDCR